MPASPDAGASPRALLTPSGRRKLPALPNPVNVLQRCLATRNGSELLPVGPHDLVLSVPALPGANLMDFDRHHELFETAYQWGRRRLDALADQGDPALAAILAAKS